MRLRGAIFDLDGTLAETLPVCLTALGRTFRKYLGRDFTNQELLSYFGPTEEGVIKKLFPKHATQCLSHYYREYEEAHELCPFPFPGVVEALEMLKQARVRLAVVTAKGAKTAALSLSYLELDHYFSFVIPGYEYGNNKPESIRKVLKLWNLHPDYVCYVGDRPSDMRAAKQTGILPLGAAWSETAELDLIQSEEPYAIFNTVDEFTDWIEQVISRID